MQWEVNSANKFRKPNYVSGLNLLNIMIELCWKEAFLLKNRFQRLAKSRVVLSRVSECRKCQEIKFDDTHVWGLCGQYFVIGQVKLTTPMWFRRTTPVFKGGTFNLQFSQLGFPPSDYWLHFSVKCSICFAPCSVRFEFPGAISFAHETRTRGLSFLSNRPWTVIFLHRQTCSGVLIEHNQNRMQIDHAREEAVSALCTGKTINRYLRTVNMCNGQETVPNQGSSMYS